MALETVERESCEDDACWDAEIQDWGDQEGNRYGVTECEFFGVARGDRTDISAFVDDFRPCSLQLRKTRKVAV